MSEKALEILFRVFILFDILVALILYTSAAFLTGVMIALLKKIR